MQAHRLTLGFLAAGLVGNLATSGWLYLRVRHLEQAAAKSAREPDSVFAKPANPWVSVTPSASHPTSAQNLDDMKLTSVMRLSWNTLLMLAENGEELSPRTRKKLLELQDVIGRIGHEAGIADDRTAQLYLILNTYVVRATVVRRQEPFKPKELEAIKDQTRIQLMGFYGNLVAKAVMKSIDELVVPW